VSSGTGTEATPFEIRVSLCLEAVFSLVEENSPTENEHALFEKFCSTGITLKEMYETLPNAAIEAKVFAFLGQPDFFSPSYRDLVGTLTTTIAQNRRTIALRFRDFPTRTFVRT
jgi:hypothetical protein